MAEEGLLDRRDAASRFLGFLVDGAPETAWLALTEIKKGLYTRSHFFTVRDYNAAAQEAIRLCDQNRSDLYVRCSLLKARPEKGRGSKEDTLGSTVLWADIDPRPGQTQENILARLNAFSHRPSWCNLSGRGVHVFWKLDQFVTDHAAVEKRNRWLAQQLGADDCFDIAHILRIPGTYNFKNPDNPKLVLPKPWPVIKYPLDSIPEAELPQADFSEVDVEPLPDDFLQNLPEKLRERILIPQEDRSANDWYVVSALLEKGFTPGQCMSVLLHPSWASGSKSREKGYMYALRTVQGAVDSQTNKNKSTHLLDPILNEVIFFVDEKGRPSKRRVRRGEELVNPAVDFLVQNGIRFYRDEQEEVGYIITPDGDVYVADSGDRDFKDWIHHISGFTDEEFEHRILRAGLSSRARTDGDRIEPTPWCHLQTAGGYTLRILLDTRGRKVLRIPSGEEPEVVINGCEGKLLRNSNLREPGTGAIEWDPDADPKYWLGFLLENFTGVLAMNQVARSILTCYALAVPLLYGGPVLTYPLLHLSGPSGGGKSQTLGLLSTWLHGSPKLLNATQAAIYRVAAREVLLPFDDYDNMPDELRQVILTAATGITRQKSGRGASDVISQGAHVLMALTSITEIEDEAVRRRALVLDVNKEQYPTERYSIEQWRLLSDNRSALWSAYAKWVSRAVLPRLARGGFAGLVKQTESLIPLDIFKPLAGFLTLMWIIASELQKLIPDALDLPNNAEAKATISLWIQELHLCDQEEIAERKELLTALQMVFEAYDALPGGYGDPEYYRTLGFRVSPTSGEKLAALGGLDEWVGLEGTTTEWMVTLNEASKRNFKVTSEKKLGHLFNRLLGTDPAIPTGAKESVPVDAFGLRFMKLLNAGARQCNRGWRVLAPVRITK